VSHTAGGPHLTSSGRDFGQRKMAYLLGSPPRLGPLLEFSKEEMHFWWGGGADECVCVVFSHMCASGYTGVRRFLALWSWVVPVLPHPPWA
jgi:hypothetical protein